MAEPDSPFDFAAALEAARVEILAEELTRHRDLTISAAEARQGRKRQVRILQESRRIVNQARRVLGDLETAKARLSEARERIAQIR